MPRLRRLHEDVSFGSSLVYRQEDHWNTPFQEVSCSRDARIVVVYADNSDIAGQVEPVRHRILKRGCVTLEQSLAGCLVCQVAEQGQGFVMANVFLPEKLAGKITQFDTVEIQQSEVTDAFAHQAVTTLTAQTTTANQDDVGARQRALISAGQARITIVDGRCVRRCGC